MTIFLTESAEGWLCPKDDDDDYDEEADNGHGEEEEAQL